MRSLSTNESKVHECHADATIPSTHFLRATTAPAAAEIWAEMKVPTEKIREAAIILDADHMAATVVAFLHMTDWDHETAVAVTIIAGEAGPVVGETAIADSDPAEVEITAGGRVGAVTAAEADSEAEHRGAATGAEAASGAARAEEEILEEVDGRAAAEILEVEGAVVAEEAAAFALAAAVMAGSGTVEALIINPKSQLSISKNRPPTRFRHRWTR